MVPLTVVIPREGSFALAFFGNIRNIQETALPVASARKSRALK
jgi:hypothetical protein